MYDFDKNFPLNILAFKSILSNDYVNITYYLEQINFGDIEDILLDGLSDWDEIYYHLDEYINDNTRNLLINYYIDHDLLRTNTKFFEYIIDYFFSVSKLKNYVIKNIDFLIENNMIHKICNIISYEVELNKFYDDLVDILYQHAPEYFNNEKFLDSYEDNYDTLMTLKNLIRVIGKNYDDAKWECFDKIFTNLDYGKQNELYNDLLWHANTCFNTCDHYYDEKNIKQIMKYYNNYDMDHQMIADHIYSFRKYDIMSIINNCDECHDEYLKYSINLDNYVYINKITDFSNSYIDIYIIMNYDNVMYQKFYSMKE